MKSCIIYEDSLAAGSDGELQWQSRSISVSNADGFCVVTSTAPNLLTFAYNNFDNQPLHYCIGHAAKTYKRGIMMLDSSHTSLLTIPVTKKTKEGRMVTLAAMRNGKKPTTY